MTLGLVVSNTTGSRKTVDRSWVRIPSKIILLLLTLEKGLYNPNRVVFDTTLKECGTTVRVLMPLLFLAHSIRLGLGLE